MCLTIENATLVICPWSSYYDFNHSGYSKYAIHPITRINATELNLDRLRHNQDLENLIDEAPTVVDNVAVLYHTTTSAPYDLPNNK